MPSLLSHHQTITGPAEKAVLPANGGVLPPTAVESLER